MVAELMRKAGEQPAELLVEKRSMQSIADENTGERRSAVWRSITSVEPKDKTDAYEQQAADAREYAVKLESELQRVYASIFALMDKNLIPSARAGESKMPYYKMKSDYNQCLAEFATDEAKGKDVDVTVMLQRQEPVIHEVRKTVEVPQVQYVDEIMDEFILAQRQVTTLQAVRNTEEVPRVQFLDRVMGVPVATQTQTPYSSAPQERILERIAEETDVPVPNMKEETIEVTDRGL